MVERPVVVSDLWFHQGSAIDGTERNPALRLPPTYRESNLRTLDWPDYRLDEWDYVLLRIRPGGAAPEVPDTLRLVRHEGGWWLYRTADTVVR